MELTLQKSDFVAQLANTRAVVEKKTTIPVLGNVLLEAVNGDLVLTGTDLELGVRVSCPASTQKPGKTTIPLQKLLDYVRLLPEGELSIKVSEQHNSTITKGKSKTRINGMSAENFPQLPTAPKATAKIPAPALVSLISKTLFAIAKEESRYTLTGALLKIERDSITMISTDGHRMAYVSIPGEFRKPEKVLIPLKALREGLRMASDAGDSTLDFATDENHLFFTSGSRQMSARRLVGQFPDYERVLPKEMPYAVELQKEEVLKALQRVSQFTDQRSKAVLLEIKSGELVIKSRDMADVGESEETLDISYAGEPVKTGFNAQYLLDFLGAVETETVVLEFKDGQSAGQFKQPGLDYRYVVMPMSV